MIRVIILLLSVTVMNCFHVSAQEDTNYLAGAVPEKDGRIVFERDYSFQGKDRDAVYDGVYKWLKNSIEKDGSKSRIVLENRDKGLIIVLENEYLVFSNSAFSLDRAEISCYLAIICEQNKCYIKIDRIKYLYEGKTIPAEELISDKVALNREKTKIFAGYKKFRIKTVDFVNELFNSVKTGFAASAF